MAERREKGTGPRESLVTYWREAKLAIQGGEAGLRWSDPLVLVLLYLLAVSAVFIAWPGLDLALSRLFFVDGGFWAKGDANLIRLRALGDQTIILILVVILASLLA